MPERPRDERPIRPAPRRVDAEFCQCQHPLTSAEVHARSSAGEVEDDDYCWRCGRLIDE